MIESRVHQNIKIYVLHCSFLWFFANIVFWCWKWLKFTATANRFQLLSTYIFKVTVGFNTAYLNYEEHIVIILACYKQGIMSSLKWYLILLLTCLNNGDKIKYFEKCLKTVSTFVHPCTWCKLFCIRLGWVWFIILIPVYE